MKYAIVEISGRQFWVETGKYYDLNRIPTELGKEITLNRVLLLNNEGEILYQGMMDDRIERLGSYKQQWKNNYLEQAILSISNNQEPKVKKTTPIGCSLEY